MQQTFGVFAKVAFSVIFVLQQLRIVSDLPVHIYKAILECHNTLYITPLKMQLLQVFTENIYSIKELFYNPSIIYTFYGMSDAYFQQSVD